MTQPPALTGAAAGWMNEFVAALQAGGASQHSVDEAITIVEHACHGQGRPPWEIFGDPRALAANPSDVLRYSGYVDAARTGPTDAPSWAVSSFTGGLGPSLIGMAVLLLALLSVPAGMGGAMSLRAGEAMTTVTSGVAIGLAGSALCFFVLVWVGHRSRRFSAMLVGILVTIGVMLGFMLLAALAPGEPFVAISSLGLIVGGGVAAALSSFLFAIRRRTWAKDSSVAPGVDDGLDGYALFVLFLYAGSVALGWYS